MPQKAVSAAILIALVAGCTVGPDYRRPEVPGETGSWLNTPREGTIDARWWASFGDTTLSALVERAMADSPDLAEATARVAEARANRDAAAGGRQPSIIAKGSVTENIISEKGQLPIASIPGFAREFPLFDIGFDASWELDFWGRQSRQIEAATARMQAAQFSRREVMLSLISEIARNYMELRYSQADDETLSGVAQADAELARLSQLRFRAGEISRMDLDRALAVAKASSAALPNARARASAAAYRIAGLVGTPPEELAPELLQPAPLPRAPETILTGLRSELLVRRPDVVRAERELAAATADIGVAKADLFPRFTLLGSVGQQARNAGDLVSDAATRLQLGPSFSWPVFALGTIRARVRAVGARADAATARYEKAVIGALADSETTVNRFDSSRAVLADAEASLEREKAAFALASRRTASGEDDRLTLEAARKVLLAAVQRRDQAAHANADGAIALFKALGGGWPD